MKLGATWPKKPADWILWKQFLVHSQGRDSLLEAPKPSFSKNSIGHFLGLSYGLSKVSHVLMQFFEKIPKTAQSQYQNLLSVKYFIVLVYPL